MKNDYLGVAVVGAGRIGTLRAKLAAKHPSVRYVAISDADPARAKALAEQSGANFHSGSNDEIIANPEVNAVLAGLDLVDLINLRDSLQQEIDNFALSALEAQAQADGGGDEAG